MPKTRLDLLMVERQMAESRSLAGALVMAGKVLVNGQVEHRPGAQILPDALLEMKESPRFVSRGGEKLEAALQSFPVTVEGRTCADVGASTGGFTDCLLQHGARRVIAIDVGKGLLHYKLRRDPRLVIMEETNARHLASLPEQVSLVTIDASFISLKILLPVVRGWLESAGGDVLALVKPQFEAGRQAAGRGKGVIRDPQIQQEVVAEVLSFAETLGFKVNGKLASPVLGPKGNVEYLAWLQVAPGSTPRAAPA